MVIGGASAAIMHGIEHAKPNYAVPAESILIAGNNNLDVGESISLIASSYGFTANSYTWTSGDESIATISGTGNTATVQGVNYGETYITASAQGANGVVTSSQFAINVQEFGIEVAYSESLLNLPINITVQKDMGYWGQNGDIVWEVESSNTNAVTAEIDYMDRIVFNVGSIEGISASVTITAKDNNGESGYRTATTTVVINVLGHYIAGDRVLAHPEGNDTTLVLLANNDKTKFVYYNASNRTLRVTSDIRQASLFALDSQSRLILCFLELQGDAAYVSTSGSGVTLVAGVHSSGAQTKFSTYFNYSDHSDQLSQDYPGFLATENDRYLAYNNNNPNYPNYEKVEMGYLHSLGNGSSANTTPPLFAYAAIETGPSITPEESSLTVNLDEYRIGTGITVSKVTSLDYEVISGASLIRNVAISEVNDENHADITIRANRNTYGTAVIRVKDANDESVYTDITVRVPVDLDDVVPVLTTRTQLSYRYTHDSNGDYHYTDMSIRFGGRINKNLWNEINTDYHIDGFGVMITAYRQYLRNYVPYYIDQHYQDAIPSNQQYDLDNDLVDFYMPTSTTPTPAEDGDDYYWNLLKSVDISDITKTYTAAAYFKIGNEYLFLEQVECSVCGLALEYINAGNTNGSLQYLYDLAFDGQE